MRYGKYLQRNYCNAATETSILDQQKALLDIIKSLDIIRSLDVNISLDIIKKEISKIQKIICRAICSTRERLHICNQGSLIAAQRQSEAQRLRNVKSYDYEQGNPLSQLVEHKV